MTLNLAIFVVGVFALMIISLVIGTTMDVAVQRRAARQSADERERLVLERRKLAREQGLIARARRDQPGARCPWCGRPGQPSR